MSEREQKALTIAAKSKVAKKGDVWLVPSQSNHGHYEVNFDLQHCTCLDYLTRQLPCKHILATEIVIERERSVTETKTSDGQTVTTTVTETVKLRYKQMWPAYNSAQVNEKARFLSLLYELCAGVDEPIQTMGRPRLSMADMIFASTYKVYSTVSSRRFMTDLKDACARRYIARVPHYNSIIGYLEKEELTPYLPNSGRTGGTNDTAGIYRASDCGKEIALSIGERFPPCPDHRIAVTWTLVRAAKL